MGRSWIEAFFGGGDLGRFFPMQLNYVFMKTENDDLDDFRGSRGQKLEANIDLFGRIRSFLEVLSGILA